LEGADGHLPGKTPFTFTVKWVFFLLTGAWLDVGPSRPLIAAPNDRLRGGEGTGVFPMFQPGCDEMNAKQRLLIVARISLVVLVFFLGATVGIYEYFSRDLPSTARLENLEPSLKTQVFAADSSLVGEFYEQNRVLLPLEEIPASFKDAIIAVEDRKFYSHWGVDAMGLVRAMIANLRAGRIVEGASTITQQLARNLFTMFDVSMSRKIKEAILALKIERMYSKDEILEMYINQINFGSGAYGVEAAAHEYFGKSARDLTLGESALLAGLPQNPRDFSPHYNLDRALQRRAVVLRAMVDAGKLSRAVADSVAASPVKIGEAASGERFAAYFLEYVRQYLEAKYGSDRVHHDGLKVYTTLDPVLQRVAEDSLESHIADIERQQHYSQTKESYEAAIAKGEDVPLEYLQGAVLAIEPHTGYIRAMVGGRSFRESKWNRAVQARRQPGSAFKPFIYLAALENGYTPADIVLDAPIVLDMPRVESIDQRGRREGPSRRRTRGGDQLRSQAGDQEPARTGVLARTRNRRGILIGAHVRVLRSRRGRSTRRTDVHQERLRP
jgi:penicillin-binding protein 1A